MSTPLPSTLEFGELCHIFASVYDGTDLSHPDTSSVLSARHVQLTDLVDFTSTVRENDKNSKNVSFQSKTSTTEQNKNTSFDSTTETSLHNSLNASLRASTTSAREYENAGGDQSFAVENNNTNNSFSSSTIESGGKTVGFDRVVSGSTRTTDLVEALLPYALSVGSSTFQSSALFINNLGFTESPFTTSHGDSSVCQQLIGNMLPWARRKGFDLEASLIAWDSWGDASDLFNNSSSSSGGQQQNKSSDNVSSLYSSSSNPNHNLNANATTVSSSSSGGISPLPLEFTGDNITGRLFDALNVVKIIESSSQSEQQQQQQEQGYLYHHSAASNALLAATGVASSSSSSRNKTISELSELVEQRVVAFRKIVAAGSFSRDSTTTSSNSGSVADHRYALCLRLDLVPFGVESNDELSWGCFNIIECSGSMLVQTRSSRRGISPSLLSSVKSLFLPSEEAPRKSQNNNQNNNNFTSTPLQSLSDLAHRPELSLASFVVGPLCTSRVAMILPVPDVVYGSASLYIQACIDAVCLARREWITFPQNSPPPGKSLCDTPGKLFRFAFEQRVKENISLRWILRRHRNCRLKEQIALIEEREEFETRNNLLEAVTRREDEQQELMLLERDKRQQEEAEEEERNRRFVANNNNLSGVADADIENNFILNNTTNINKVKFKTDDETFLKAPIVTNSNSNKNENNISNNQVAIPALDAWIVAMRRRLQSLEEVEAEQQEWHSWLESYREWLLSIPASGAATGTISVPVTTNNSGTTTPSNQQTSTSTHRKSIDQTTTTTTQNENINANSNKNLQQQQQQVQFSQQAHIIQTISWAERCELLERIVAQQQEELKRVKRICARDIENLREEVYLLRSGANETNNSVNNDNTNQEKNKNQNAVPSTNTNIPSAYLEFEDDSEVKQNLSQTEKESHQLAIRAMSELRIILQNFERDVVSIKNNAILTPEDASFEVTSMVERLAHDAEAIVRPMIENDTTTRGRGKSSSSSSQHPSYQLIIPEWRRREKKVDQEQVFRHERLRLRALAGALARGCDDLASRIQIVVDENEAASSSSSSLLFQNQEDENNNTHRDNSNKNKNNTSFRQLDEQAQMLHLVKEATKQSKMKSQNINKNRNNSNKNNISALEMSTVDPTVNSKAKYSHSVLTKVHEEWCRNVALALRNTSEGVASQLDDEIHQRPGTKRKSTVNQQDAGIAELCARFFANRASRVIAGKSAKQEREEEENVDSALSRVLKAARGDQQYQQGGDFFSADPNSSNMNANQQQQLQHVVKMNSVSLNTITGRDPLLAANLRSSKFKKGTFSDATTSVGGSSNAPRSITPRAAGRR